MWGSETGTARTNCPFSCTGMHLKELRKASPQRRASWFWFWRSQCSEALSAHLLQQFTTWELNEQEKYRCKPGLCALFCMTEAKLVHVRTCFFRHWFDLFTSTGWNGALVIFILLFLIQITRSSTTRVPGAWDLEMAKQNCTLRAVKGTREASYPFMPIFLITFSP